MKGIIMAGGEGSRLRPLTCGLPKPMVPVVNKPVMSYCVELLRKHGIVDIGVTLQYRPEAVKDYFDDGRGFNVNLRYFIEDTPLGTAGSVKNAEEFLDETFIVISGDALTDIDLKKAIEFHRERKSVATLVLKRVEIPLEYGVVVTDTEGSIQRFLEKPNWGEVFSDTVNTGIYILEPEVLSYFKGGEKFDFSKDLFPLLLKEKLPMYGYVTDEYWCDIGNPMTYLSAHYDMLSKHVKLDVDGKVSAEGIILGNNVSIAQGARIEGPCYIGSYTKVDKNTYIGPYTVIGSNCCIGYGTSIKKGILWDNVVLKGNAEIRGAIFCSNVEADKGVSVYEGAVIGEGCELKEGSIVKPQVKIWPGKTIEEGHIVNSNIIWGTRSGRTLFGKCGIKGFVNTDLTPHTTARIGASYGAYLNPGKRVGISCDSSQASNMIKFSMISGMLSVGVEIFDMGQLATPVSRYAIKHLRLDGGIHIFTGSDINRACYIYFMDENGCNLSPSAERKIENLFIRDDFLLQSPEAIKRVHTLNDIPVFYIRSVLDDIQAEVINAARYRILLSSDNRLCKYIIHRILNDSGCQVHISRENIQKELKSGTYDLGCALDPDCEGFTLYSPDGSLVDKGKQQALLSLVYLKDKPGRSMVVPYTAPSIIDKIAVDYNCSVERTKSARHAVMERALKHDSVGNVTKLFPLYYDGIYALVKLIEFMAKEGASLNELLARIPSFYSKERTVKCPWSSKGKVMRSIIEEESKTNKSVELFEGVRISYEKGSALILPDPDEPVCRVYSEGFSEEYAEELASVYEKKIIEISNNQLEN
ncbi:MAG TPA: sugar phosphate nucleotidyltransferase [Candidatus Atribacteria bacterium]|nr:sugar phosphate nucleotidyltransferase [Candidatus Atribacteria bacterium]